MEEKIMYLALCDKKDDGCGKTYPGDLVNCPHCGAARDLIAVPAPIPFNTYVYDIETYPNIFTFACLHPFSNSKWLFEISDRKNEAPALLQFSRQLMINPTRMVGYNNIHFDWEVMDYILNAPQVTVEGIFEKVQSIFNSDSFHNYKTPSIPQIDLFKIHNFDNNNKRTSLKDLEFFMRMKNIQDLPFPPGTVLNDKQKNKLIKYNWHDVKATTYFWIRTLEMIEFRDTLTQTYNKDFTNFSNTKLGLTLFQMKLEEVNIDCYQNGYAKKTIRDTVQLKDCIPDYIQFEHPEFQKILHTFKNTTLVGDNVKSLFKDFNCTIDGITYEFGAGGQHASREGLFQADNEFCIVDVDVEAMYPWVIAVNNYYPEHLGPGFCPIFKELIDERIRVGKKTLLGMGLKESANATYGNLGQPYSFVYDLKTLLSTTLTGQLTLSMLVEQVIKIDGATILQTNTDGFTIHMRRSDLGFLTQLVNWWENITKLKMEYNYYSRMWLKNVNSYIAEDEKTGKLKLKKDYNYNLEYHKNPSALIVPKAIEAHLVHGKNIRHFITNHKDPFDFMIRGKVPRDSKLILRVNGYDLPQQRITRYFISNEGGELIKISPPKGKLGEYKRANKLTDDYFNRIMSEIGPGVWDERIHTKNKSTYTIRETALDAGWKSAVCNNADHFNWDNLNYEYYIAETEKLIIN